MGILYLIATPIGNLGDISFRAIETLKTLDLLLCEDTRVTARLLERYGLSVPLDSYREQVHGKQIGRLSEMLVQGKTLGLVSDAGMPGISDPGSWLVRDLLKAVPDVEIVPIPGPTAAIAALCASGLPTDQFVFLGFPPHKKGKAAFLKRVLEENRTSVVYESPHRIVKTLQALNELEPERPACLVREITKIHETYYRGTVSEILDSLPETEVRGEFVLVIGPPNS